MKRTLGVLFDVVMVFLTGGLWIIWILVRYLRANSNYTQKKAA